MALRIGIIGARRRREGTGPFIARQLAALGADVAAIVATRPDTLRQAQTQLAACGIAPRGYLSAAEMLQHERLDAVAICAPPAYRREHLRAALRAGVHVLCEKPLVWEPHGDDRADAAALIDALAAAGRVLMVVEQWPYTLPDFCRLHRLQWPLPPPHDIVMWLAPGDCGAAMVPQALPHPLSLLLALCGGGGRIVQPTAEVHLRDASGRATCCTLRFGYGRASGDSVQVTVLLQQSAVQPRAAGYGIDGRYIARRLLWPQYGFAWQRVERAPLPSRRWDDACGEGGGPASDAPCVPGEDPLARLLRDFLERCRQPGASPGTQRLADGVRLLHELYHQWRAVLDGDSATREPAAAAPGAPRVAC